ncbi:MAG: hypothetical protein AAGM22_25550 [Acidobacteriota bacterium]
MRKATGFRDIFLRLRTADGIFAQLFTGAGPSGGEIAVNSDTAAREENADVAMAADGALLVTWDSVRQGTADENGIYAQRFASDGSKRGAEFQVETYTAGGQMGFAVAVTGAGDFIVVWRSEGSSGNDLDGYSIQAQLLPPTARRWRGSSGSTAISSATRPNRRRAGRRIPDLSGLRQAVRTLTAQVHHRSLDGLGPRAFDGH